MAAKISTLRWDAAPDGGSAITGYRVLAFEGDTVVSEVEVETTSTTITHSATVERLVLIQAVNDQGYSAPTYLSVPKGVATTPGGGGTDPGGGTNPGGPATAPVPPTITAVRNATNPACFDIAASVAATGTYDHFNIVLTSGSSGEVPVASYADLPATYFIAVGGATYSANDAFTAWVRVWYKLNGQDQYLDSNKVTVPAYVAPPVEDDNTPLGMSITRAGDSLTFNLTGPATSTQRNLYAYDGGAYSRLSGDFALPTSFTLTNGYTAANSSTALFRFEARSAAGANLGVNTDNPRIVALSAPTIAAVRNGHVITVTQTAPGGGYNPDSGSVLYRDGAAWNQPAGLPFTDTHDGAHSYYVRVTDGTTTLDSNSVSAPAYIS